jgi:hypothetical protein
MATITSLNQYKASYADSTDLTVAAETLADAIVALAEAKPGEPSLIQRTEVEHPVCVVWRSV